MNNAGKALGLAFDDRLTTDDRFDRVMRPLCDGLSLLRVR
jgi:hypothetical protein